MLKDDFYFLSEKSQWPNLAYLISGIGQIYFTYPSGEEIEYLIMKMFKKKIMDHFRKNV